jgi:hypothetical protein
MFDPNNIVQKKFEECIVSIEAPYINMIDFPSVLTRATECKLLYESNIKENEEKIEIRILDEFGSLIDNVVTMLLNNEDKEFYPFARYQKINYPSHSFDSNFNREISFFSRTRKIRVQCFIDGVNCFDNEIVC